MLNLNKLPLLSGAALFALALAGPGALYAQDAPEGEGEQPRGEEGAEPEAPERSEEEMMAELEKLVKEVDESMQELESKIAEASSEPLKPDEVKAQIDAIAEKLRKGESLDELPAGIQSYLKKNPEELAEALGETKEEAEKLVEDQQELLKRLNEAGEKSAELLENMDALEEILEETQKIEDDMKDVIEKQRETSKQTEDEMKRSLELAYALRKQCNNPGQGQPKPGEQEGEKKQGEQSEGKEVKKPSSGAEEGYDGNGQKNTGPEVGEESRQAGENSWDVAKRDKEAERARSSTEESGEPSRYKNFREAFLKAMKERASKASQGDSEE